MIDLDEFYQKHRSKLWYDSLIYDALKAGLPVILFKAEDGYLGVKIGDIKLPYFDWECFEQEVGDFIHPCPERDEEISRARSVIGLIVDVKLNKSSLEDKKNG